LLLSIFRNVAKMNVALLLQATNDSALCRDASVIQKFETCYFKIKIGREFATKSIEMRLGPGPEEKIHRSGQVTASRKRQN
jgi:hypothetical protein